MAKIEAEDVDLADKEFTAVAACYDPYCNKLDMFICPTLCFPFVPAG